MGSCELPKLELPIPWRRTPLIESATLSRAAGCRIFLKLENIQPAASFKSRGIGNLILSTVQARQSSPNSTPSNLHFYCSSGGNAGLAAIAAAKTLGYPCSVVVPRSTAASMVAKLKAAGATDVVVHGDSWMFADQHMREEVMVAASKRGEDPVHVHPFDRQKIWEGAATMIQEMAEQIPGGKAPDGIVCSVGGGGLYCGVMLGLEQMNWDRQTKVAAVETEGAESLNASVKKGELVTLKNITSVAKSLGAVRVAQQAFDYARDVERTTSMTLPDGEACMACVKFADDERIMVEPACGASVALAYSPQRLKEAFGRVSPESKIVIVVCGGTAVSLGMLDEWKHTYGGEFEMVGKQTDAVSSNYSIAR